MSQYEVAKLLHERAQPQSKEQLAREIGVQPATVGDTLRKLRGRSTQSALGRINSSSIRTVMKRISRNSNRWSSKATSEQNCSEDQVASL